MSARRIGHTAAYPGKRVRVFFTDGTVLDGRFHGRNDRVVMLDVGKFAKRRIRSIAILKGESR